MAATVQRYHHWALHPLHAALVAGTAPLFLGALLCDIAYWHSYQVQWTDFASWLIAGGVLLGAVALVWALVSLLRAGRGTGRSLLHAAVLLAMCTLGFVNALVHARDAWAAMPAGLVLSAVVAVLACVATATGFSGGPAGGRA